MTPEERYRVGIFEQYEKSGYTKKDHQSYGSNAEKVRHSKKRSHAKKRTHKQQQHIFKRNNFGRDVALNRWRYLGGCMLMSVGMLSLCWMAWKILQ